MINDMRGKKLLRKLRLKEKALRREWDALSGRFDLTAAQREYRRALDERLMKLRIEIVNLEEGGAEDE